jgi:hypothetical protein
VLRLGRLAERVERRHGRLHRENRGVTPHRLQILKAAHLVPGEDPVVDHGPVEVRAAGAVRAQQALDGYNQLREQNRLYAELGLITVPANPGEDGKVPTDENGEPMTRRLPVDEADAYTASMFAQSIPDLVASDEERINSQIRAAAYRQMVEEKMAPSLDLQRNLGNLYGARTSNLSVSPEIQQAIAANAALMDLGQTEMADATGLYASMLPEIMGAQNAMQAQQTEQSQMEQMLLQEQLRQWQAANPELFPSQQAAADPFSIAEQTLSP